jgi:hypothetical protein
MRGSGV